MGALVAAIYKGVRRGADSALEPGTFPEWAPASHPPEEPRNSEEPEELKELSLHFTILS